MTIMKSDADVLASKIDEMRKDLRTLLPLLGLLEPPDHDQMSGFAERLLAFMQEIEMNYGAQATQFAALRDDLQRTDARLNVLSRQLEFLTTGG